MCLKSPDIISGAGEDFIFGALSKIRYDEMIYDSVLITLKSLISSLRSYLWKIKKNLKCICLETNLLFLNTQSMSNDAFVCMTETESSLTLEVLTYMQKAVAPLRPRNHRQVKLLQTFWWHFFAIKVGPVAIFPLSAQAKYQGTVRGCFAPLVELIRCSQRTALSSHCSAHSTASV